MIKKIIIALLLVLVIAGGAYYFFVYRPNQQTQAAESKLETAALEKGSLVSTISATGSVRPNQTATLSWSTSGTVESVDVKVGDAVTTSQVLARLKETTLPQAVIAAQAELVSAQQSLDDLYTEAETARLKAQQDIMTYEQSVRDAQLQVDNYIIPSNQAGMTITLALETMKQRLDDARTAFDKVKFYDSTDQRREDQKDLLDQAQSDYNSAIKRLEYEYELEVAQANLANAWKNFEKYRNGPVPGDIEALKAKIAAAQATLNQAWIEAPFDGVITSSKPLPGDQVTASKAAFRIDDLSEMYIDVNISEVDIQQIKAGQPVTITFDALKGKTYQGEVSQVAMISSDSSSEVSFPVEIKVLNPDSEVRSGMTAEVQIVVARKDNVLMIPLQAVQVENGKQKVYVMRGGIATPVDVELGSSSDAYSELIKGDIKEGDEIVLNPTALEGDTQNTNSGGSFMGGPPRERNNSSRNNQP